MTQQPPRRGCVALRPLGLADILDGSFRVIRRNPGATLGLSAVLAVIRVAVTAGLQLGAYRTLNSVQLELLGTLVVGAALGTVLTGLLTLVVTQDVLGVRISTREVLTRLRGRAWALLGLALVITVLESLALLPLLVLGVWLWGLWAVAVPVLMVERSTVRGALSRSRRLVSGLWWRVWGIRALGFLLASLLGALVTVPFILLASLLTGSGFTATGVNSGVPVAYVLIISVGSVLSSTLTSPIRAGIDALLYLDLRMRREGLDIVLHSQASPVRPVAPPAGARSAF
ncbi:MAG TPA: hypothetical protein VIM17_00590 [Jatrophihabitantaceae bacterium]